MPKNVDLADKKALISVKNKFISIASENHTDINEWIEYLMETVKKKATQYETMKHAHDELLNDFESAVGKSYDEWCEERASAVLEASK